MIFFYTYHTNFVKIKRRKVCKGNILLESSVGLLLTHENEYERFLKVSEYTRDVCVWGGGWRGVSERERIGKTTWHIPYLYSKMLYVPTCAMLTMPKKCCYRVSVQKLTEPNFLCPK